jgi:hypothetical protein
MAESMGLVPTNHLELFEKKMLKKLGKGPSGSAVNTKFK